jgi:hypothetical protein
MAEELRQENKRLQAEIVKLSRQQEIQKKRVTAYLTKTFAERDILKEECNKLQNEAENLLKELTLLKPRQHSSSNPESPAKCSNINNCKETNERFEEELLILWTIDQ